MHTMASKNSASNGSDRASAWIGKTPSPTPASRMRWRFSEALNHRSVAGDLHAELAAEEDRRRRPPAAEVEHPQAGPQVQRGREPLGQPQRVGSAADAGDDPLGMVLRRAGRSLGDELLV